MNFRVLGVLIAFSLMVLLKQCHGAETVESCVSRFLDATLRVERFSTPHYMEYHMNIEYPDGTPASYIANAKYQHWVSPPSGRYEALLGPYLPSNQPATGWLCGTLQRIMLGF